MAPHTAADEKTAEPRTPVVLIADDDESIRTLVSRMLRRAGFDPVEATDGQDAIEKLASRPFDALVLDLMMPRVDGFGVYDYLVGSRPLMTDKTVVVSAFPRAATSQRLPHLRHIVSKPFDIGELTHIVRECTQR